MHQKYNNNDKKESSAVRQSSNHIKPKNQANRKTLPADALAQTHEPDPLF